MNYCSAMAERRRVERRERLFRHQDSSRFRIPGKQRSRCSKLRVDGRLVSDPEELLTAWASHVRKAYLLECDSAKWFFVFRISNVGVQC